MPRAKLKSDGRERLAAFITNAALINRRRFFLSRQPAPTLRRLRGRAIANEETLAGDAFLIVMNFDYVIIPCNARAFNCATPPDDFIASPVLPLESRRDVISSA